MKKRNLTGKKQKLLQYVKRKYGDLLVRGHQQLLCGLSDAAPGVPWEQAKCCGSVRKIFKEKKDLIMYYDEIREADFDYYTISFDDERLWNIS